MYLTFYVFSLTVILLGNIDKILLSGFPIRKVTFVCFFIITVGTYLIRQKFRYQEIYFIISSGIIFVVFGLSVPIHKGLNLNHSIYEMIPYFIPICSVFLISTINKYEFERYEQAVLRIVFLFSLIHVAFAITAILDSNISKLFYSVARYFYDRAEGFDSLPDMNNSYFIPRFQLGMSIVLLLGLFICLKQYIYGKLNRIHLLSFILAILVTQSRAIIISVCFLPLFYFFFKLYLVNYSGRIQRIFLLYFVLMLPSVFIVFIILNDPLESLGLVRDAGENLRILQLESFLRGIYSDIVFGIGVGNHSDVIRSTKSPWIYELNNISFLLKTGIVGIVSINIYIIYFLQVLTLKRKKMTGKCSKEYSLAVSFLFVFILSANTNPYLSNFVGGFFLMYLFFVIGSIEKKEFNDAS